MSKDTKGQLNMFDFFGDDVQILPLMPDDEFIDDAIIAGFEQELPESDEQEDGFPMEVVRPFDISEEEQIEEPVKESVKESVEEPKKESVVKKAQTVNTYNLTVKDKNKPVMVRCFSLAGNSVDGVLAYLDYNRIYVKELGKSPVCYQFSSSKSAVNFYVEQMKMMKKDNVMKMVDKEAVIVPTEAILMEE